GPVFVLAGRLLLIIARQIGRSPGSCTWRSTPNVLRSAARSISRPLLARVVDYRAVVMIGFEGDVRDRRRGEDIFRARLRIEPRNLCDRAIDESETREAAPPGPLDRQDPGAQSVRRRRPGAPAATSEKALRSDLRACFSSRATTSPVSIRPFRAFHFQP